MLLFRLIPKLLLLSLLAASVACGEHHVSAWRHKPAALRLDGINRLAVAEVTGPGGGILAEKISDVLLQRNHLIVVERAAVSRLLQEQNLRPIESARSGFLGADAILLGRVLRRDYVEDFEMTESAEEGRDSETQVTRTGHMTVEGRFRLVCAYSGEILDSVTLEASAVQEDTRTVKRPAADVRLPRELFGDADRDGLARRAGDKIAESLGWIMTPHRVVAEFVLYSDKKVPDSGRAVALAQAGQFVHAAKLYRQGVDAASHKQLKSRIKARVHYNLGMTLAFSNDFQGAVQELETAIGLSPDAVFIRELVKVRGYKLDYELAQRQHQAARCARDARACDLRKAKVDWQFVPPPLTAEECAPSAPSLPDGILDEVLLEAEMSQSAVKDFGWADARGFHVPGVSDEVGYAAAQGHSDRMDSTMVTRGLDGGSLVALFNGEDAAEAAQAAVDVVPNTVSEHLRSIDMSKPGQVRTALANAFARDVSTRSPLPTVAEQLSGIEGLRKSSAEAAVISPAGIYVASMGTCRTLLVHEGGNITRLSADRRDLALGARPIVGFTPRQASQRALVVGCQGVFDVLSESAVGTAVAASLAQEDAPTAAARIVHAAFNRGSADSISVLVVPL